ncbi:MAG: hypothetical protein WC467_02375 [Patescibacteria group bacterium]
MIREKFSVETEIKKIQCVFRGIKNDWKDKKDLSVEFRHFEDVAPAGETIDGYMNDQLFGNYFSDFTLFAATIHTDRIAFWLAIAEDDNSAKLKTSYHFYFKDHEKNKSKLGLRIGDEIELWDAREVIWKIYDFFDSDADVRSDAEKSLQILLNLKV